VTPLSGTREDWLAAFVSELYGPIPDPLPVAVTPHPLPDANAERLTLTIEGFTVDACLWRPAAQLRGVIIALDFLGPAGVLLSDAYPFDPNAIVALPPWRGDGSGPLDASLRGAGRHRWPVETMLAAGWAVMTSCYGSWVPDSPERWRDSGLVPLLGEGTRAISLWAWALQRMADAASQLGLGAIVLAGHSRLGKAALWAAANDTRVAAVLSNDSGCGGASLSRHAPIGSETLAVMRARFPHWLLPEKPLSVDQHQLLAAIAPRALHVASANDDAWADPQGEYLALAAAASAWGLELPPLAEVYRPGGELSRGALGWHLRPGGHELLPYDWARFLSFLDTLPLHRPAGSVHRHS